MRWFRMYVEVVDDPKVQRLSDKMFKFWVNCLCLCANNEGFLPSIKDLCWKFHKTEEEIASRLAALHEAGLLDQEADTFSPHNWHRRQYKSDVSTARVKRHRQRLGNVSETSVSVRISETESDTENTSGENPSPGKLLIDQISERIYARHPPSRRCSVAVIKKKLQAIVRKLPKSQQEQKLWRIDGVHDAWCKSPGWTKDGGEYAKGLENWLAPSMGRFDEAPHSLFDQPKSTQPPKELTL